ncbi:hypothetical protein AHiyo8_01700 [Arthrobacter sp. Hiyo8]|nr:hypothetical protein AHiyo8_01700 [Arthrobacter sp. Hiyo8]
MTTETSIPELAAEVIVDAHAIDRHDDESALQAFAWALGPDIDYEQGLREFADAIHGQLTAVARLLDRESAIDLIDAKIELLSEYKLEYPQDYAPMTSPKCTWRSRAWASFAIDSRPLRLRPRTQQDPRHAVGVLLRSCRQRRHAGGISSDAPA